MPHAPTPHATPTPSDMKMNMRSRVSLMVLRICTRLTAPKMPMPRAMLSPTQSMTAALARPANAIV